MDLRVFGEREIGLDIYLSGVWGILPLVLGIVSATVFLLAIFKYIPIRKHSVLTLLAAGLIAAGVGLGGAYLGYRDSLNPAAPPHRIVREGKGGDPLLKPDQSKALLSLPLILGGAVLAADIAGALFLLIFWGNAGQEKKAPEKKE